MVVIFFIAVFELVDCDAKFIFFHLSLHNWLKIQQCSTELFAVSRFVLKLRASFETLLDCCHHLALLCLLAEVDAMETKYRCERNDIDEDYADRVEDNDMKVVPTDVV